MKTWITPALVAILISGAIACSDSKSTTTNPVSPTPPSTTPAPAPAPAPTPQMIVLTGAVVEVPPSKQPVPGARVEIATGPNAGRFMMTDSTGVFRLVDLAPATITVIVRKDGYQLWQITNLALTADRRQDVSLFPTPPTNTAGATATARCNDGTWSWAQTRAEACTANAGVAYGVCPGVLCDPQ